MKVRSLKKKLFLVAAAASALVVGTALPASAVAVSLGPSDLYGSTKVYYAKERIKPSSGGVTMRVTNISWTSCPTSCGGGQMHTGMRNQSAADEDTNFPQTETGNTVSFKNIRNNSYTFGTGSYWFNAQYQGNGNGSSGVWSGTLNW